MSIEMTIVSHAPLDSRCDCEARRCTDDLQVDIKAAHTPGDCYNPAFLLIELFGHRHRLCIDCFTTVVAWLHEEADKERRS